MSFDPLDGQAAADLLAAHALDALEPDEAAAVDEVAARSPALAAELDRLRRAAAWIGVAEALAPPARVRDAVLRDAVARRAAPTPVQVLRAEADRLEETLADVARAGDDVLARPTPNGLVVRDLLAHLAAQESLFAENAGVGTDPDLAVRTVDARTAELAARLAAEPVAVAIARWRAATDAVAAWGEQAAGTVEWMDSGVRLDVGDALVARAFETWVHHDDLRRALGRPLAQPSDGTLRVMAGLSVRLLPLGLAATGRARDGTLRLRLTGPGGEWAVPLGPDVAAGAPVLASLSCDVVDWCRLVGDRVSPADLVAVVEGDRAVVDDVLVAASAFAML